jgi:hypothetical protein
MEIGKERKENGMKMSEDLAFFRKLLNIFELVLYIILRIMFDFLLSVTGLLKSCAKIKIMEIFLENLRFVGIFKKLFH